MKTLNMRNRIAMFILALLLGAPIALSITASWSSATGWIVASGVAGEPVCKEGDGNECTPE